MVAVASQMVTVTTGTMRTAKCRRCRHWLWLQSNTMLKKRMISLRSKAKSTRGQVQLKVRITFTLSRATHGHGKAIAVIEDRGSKFVAYHSVILWKYIHVYFIHHSHTPSSALCFDLSLCTRASAMSGSEFFTFRCLPLFAPIQFVYEHSAILLV